MEKDKEKERSRIIIRTSIIGIAANVLLALFKAIVGMLSGSIAIILDAVNNLSDAASSLITIIGTKLAGKQPDKKHPFGYGRIEYLSALLISMIVLYAGVTSLSESVKKILNPQLPDYTNVTLIIVAAAVLVKFFLSRYVKRIGEATSSASLQNSGQDALLDSMISASTLAAALLYLRCGLSLEAWLGVFISLLIIRSGIEMVRETVSRLLGEPGDLQLAMNIKKTVASFSQVHGVYDLVLHDYGPEQNNGSLHIEVDDTLNAAELDQLIRSITEEVYRKHQVILTAISIYSVNTRDPEAIRIREKVRKIVLSHENVKQLHGFYLDSQGNMRFDIVISFAEKDRKRLFEEVIGEVRQAFPNHEIRINMDMDLSEL